MIKIEKILLVIFCMCFISCDRVSDVASSLVAESINNGIKRYSSPYQGTWLAHYTGDETGTFVLIVDERGYVEVDIKSYSSNYTDKFRGGIVLNGGGLQQVWNENFAIYGSLFNKRGTWKMGNKSGEWIAVKQ